MIPSPLSPNGFCHVPKEDLVPMWTPPCPQGPIKPLVPMQTLLCPHQGPCPPMFPLPCPQDLREHNPVVPSECPAIMPRCLWGAHPYRGTPAPLQPPLGSVFLHHTLEPSRPCRTFSACARAMRDMQRFHQDTRGWDDIGYRSLSPPWGDGSCHRPWQVPLPVGVVIVLLWGLSPPLVPTTLHGDDHCLPMVPVYPHGHCHPLLSPSLSHCSPCRCPLTNLTTVLS